ncbi:potassium-transporting ATPase subunit F [Aureimonas sp. OT7]|uniref:ATPase n=1 Tax=Aureimonas altamirensis TaxID=370622 RepID=A0A0B1Q323_9HYPH|nr:MULTISPECIES: potassium-transporting ATPase subunit F [Aureimonas]KHJ53220.1 ATPase [Aureimonas altamirensis]QOG05229.1 potassium-transporting ATPase subunit F [Aureimonas sp. OT7]
MTGFDFFVGGITTVFVAAYLGYVLMRPERF